MGHGVRRERETTRAEPRRKNNDEPSPQCLPLIPHCLVCPPPPPPSSHSYIVYGPLAVGCTTFMFESTPLYPDHNRYWQMVARHKLTTLYTAPTAVRALMKYPPPPHGNPETDRSTLRVLGSVGEPINPEGQHTRRWGRQKLHDGALSSIGAPSLIDREPFSCCSVCVPQRGAGTLRSPATSRSRSSIPTGRPRPAVTFSLPSRARRR